MADEADWYYVDRDGDRGPVEMTTLRRLALLGHIDGETPVWRTGMAAWEPARLHVETVRPSRGAVPPPADWPRPPGRSGYRREVGIGEALGLMILRTFDLRGRSNRGEYWWAWLAVFLLGLLAGILDFVLFGPVFLPPLMAGPLGTALLVLTGLPWIALSVRRLHDIGWNGWIVGLALLPLPFTLPIVTPTGTLWSPHDTLYAWAAFTVLSLVLSFLACVRPTEGPNRYG